MQAYVDRDDVLLELGFPSYANYLSGKLWKSIRDRVLSAGGKRCFCCGRKAKQIHHRDYQRSTLTGDDLTAMAVICGRCHKKVEITKSGKKRTLAAANRRLAELKARGKVKAAKHGSDLCWNCRRPLNKRMPTCKACRGVRKDAVSVTPEEAALVGSGEGPTSPTSNSLGCVRCGKRPMRGARYCRPCYRFTRTGQDRFESIHLPLCQGKDCVYQAKVDSNYCGIHIVDPSLSLKDYMRFRKRARKAGVRV